MITINLISEKKKQEIKFKHIYALLKKLDFVLLIVVCSIAMLILGSKIILQNSFNQTISQTTLITKNSQGYNNKVHDINSKISSVEQVQKDFYVWSKLFTELDMDLPSGIRLTYIKAGNDKAVILRGVATTREELLNFKAKLEKSLIISDPVLPISSILNKEDIHFEINAKLNLEKLKL
ncbi:hypothetical protein HGA64_01980 [Candidatus Falkowbacteria bacterium]|nr:hypothetical protein [Candidatus Falkowbacteria bacterium]